MPVANVFTGGERRVGPDMSDVHSQASGGDARLTVRVRGQVQGVGFRWWTRSRALELGLAGSATNLPGGGVEVIAQGPQSACIELLELLSAQPAPPVPAGAPRSYYRRPGRVEGVEVVWTEPLANPPRRFIEG